MTQNTSNPEEFYQSCTKYMNEQRQDSLLLFAWNMFGVGSAKSATMTQLDSKSFTLDIKTSSLLPPFEKTVKKSYTFEPPLLQPLEARERLVRLNDRYSIVSVPIEGSTIIAVGLWVSLLASIIQAKELLAFSAISKLKDLSLSLYGTPEHAAYIMIIVMIVHTLEAVMVYFFLRNVHFGKGAKQTWLSLTLLLGFGVTTRAYALSKIAKPKESKKTK